MNKLKLNGFCKILISLIFCILLGLNNELIHGDDASGVMNNSFDLTLKTIYNNNSLESVSFSYSIDDKLFFDETDIRGIKKLRLMEGIYDFNFYKDGFKNIKEKIIIDKEKSLNITFTDPLHKDGEDKSLPKHDSFGIKIDSPKESIISTGTLTIEFSIESDEKLECQLLSRKEGARGFTIKTIKKTSGRNNSLITDYSEPDKYTFRIKCYDEYGNYDLSDLLTVQIGSEVAKALKEEDMISGYLIKIDNALKQIEFLEPTEKKIILKKNIDSEQREYKKRLNALQDEFRIYLKTNATEEEVKAKKELIMKEILEVNKKIVSTIRISEIHEKMIYLPDHTFEDIFRLYERNSFLSQYSYTKEELKFLQENIVLSQRISHIVIEYEDKPTERITLITKSFKKDESKTPHHSFSNKDVLYAEFIPAKIAMEGEILFFSEQEMIEKELYLITPEDGKIEYVILNAVQNSDARQAISLILPKASLTSMSSITGHTIFDFTGSSGNIAFFIIIFIIVIIGGTTFIPGTPLNSIIRKRPEEELNEYLTNTISCIEKFGVKKSIILFPRALDLFEKVSVEQKKEYLPMVSLLSKYLELESISKELEDLNRKIIFQSKLPSIDLNLTEHIIRTYGEITQRYEGLPDNIKDNIKVLFEEIKTNFNEINTKFNLKV